MWKLETHERYGSYLNLGNVGSLACSHGARSRRLASHPGFLLHNGQFLMFLSCVMIQQGFGVYIDIAAGARSNA